MTTAQNTGKQFSLPGAGFELIQHDIISQAQLMRSANPPEQLRFNVEQEYSLLRIASRGVLGVLQILGVEDAATLSERLTATSAHDPLTDIYTVAAQYEHELQSDGPDDPGDQEEQRRLAALAQATGKTAQAALAATLGRRTALPKLVSARQEVLECERPARSVAGYALHALLDKAEDTLEPKKQLAA